MKRPSKKTEQRPAATPPRATAPRRLSTDEQLEAITSHARQEILPAVEALGLPAARAGQIADAIAAAAAKRALDASLGIPLPPQGIDVLAESAKLEAELALSSVRHLLAVSLPLLTERFVEITTQNLDRGAKAIEEATLAERRAPTLERLSLDLAGVVEAAWPIEKICTDTDLIEAFFPQWEADTNRLLPIWERISKEWASLYPPLAEPVERLARCAELFPVDFRANVSEVLDSMSVLREKGQPRRPLDHARLHAALTWGIFEKTPGISRLADVYEITSKALRDDGYETPDTVKTWIYRSKVIVDYSTPRGTKSMTARRPAHFPRRKDRTKKG